MRYLRDTIELPLKIDINALKIYLTGSSRELSLQAMIISCRNCSELLLENYCILNLDPDLHNTAQPRAQQIKLPRHLWHVSPQLFIA